MPVEGAIADAAQGELPLTWDALESSPKYGDSFLESKVERVMVRIFGETVPEDAQETLDPLVIDYAGKMVALEIINPGIDYWGKQPLQIGASGRNEQKGYGARQDDLRELRKYLLEQTRLMWPDVEALLPNRRVKRIANVPRVAQVVSTMTPDPYGFERPFGDPAETA